MNKKTLLLAFGTVLIAHSQELEKITVKEPINTQIVQDVGANEIKSADLAEALNKNIPSINIIRRSGIANDILVRGQKRDNINVIIDGAKICGACVNRMDPPTSHVLSNNVETIEVQEGPFDVENFGTLSALVKIKTIKPQKETSGEISLNAGSFGYNKYAGRISGGYNNIRVLLSASRENSNQYKDGNGDDFAAQIAKNIIAGKVPPMAQYQDRYKNLDAYTKSTFMSKLFIDITKDQELRLSYTANRSDKILYPSSKMDAIYDDSDIYNLEYDIKNIAKYSKLLNLQLYQSEVKHPMSTKYRKMGTNEYTTHKLTTKMQGLKIKNSFNLSGIEWIIGLDTSKRNWDGYFKKNDMVMKMPNGMIMKSLDDVDTTNQALFIKAENSIKNIDLQYGLRYDDTTVKSARKSEKDNDYNSISANILATINASDSLSYFIAAGKSNRVPDARELYLVMMKKHIGSPWLDQTKNYEIDLGVEKIYDFFSIKTKAYYSVLKDYIAYNSDKTQNSFENIDAKIYGFEISGNILASDNLYLDYGVSYKRGKKDHPLESQKGVDLADMRPLKANIAVNYDYSDKVNAKLQFIGSSRWDKIDYENGEQELKGYGVVNFKADYRFENGFKILVGVDNLLDKTYALTNTYKDLVLLTAGNKSNDIMLLNEPGRYFYVQGSYRF